MDRSFSWQAGPIDANYVGAALNTVGTYHPCIWVRDSRDNSYYYLEGTEPAIQVTQVCTTAHGVLAREQGRLSQARSRVLRSHGAARVRARRQVSAAQASVARAEQQIPTACAGHAELPWPK